VSKSGAIFNWLVTLGEEVTFRGEAALGFPRGARLGRFGGRRGAGASLGNQHFLPEDLVQTHHAMEYCKVDVLGDGAVLGLHPQLSGAQGARSADLEGKKKIS
jgi:hypothetical protein